MGFESRDEAETYELQDDDTLETIAERERAEGNPVTAADIARFNWGTDDEDVIDEFLRDELGCYKLGPDKRFRISADSDVRTELLIPKAYTAENLSLTRTHTLRVRTQPEPPDQFEGCTIVRGICFEFDKSFIRPEVVSDLQRIEDVASDKPDAKILIFGHTDKVGSDEYNKGLSERRALSTYAFITDQPDIWNKLYTAENWGLKSVQAILKDMGGDLDPGPVDGINGDKTRTAVRNFQTANGLGVDGVAGTNTRRELFRLYMTGTHDVEIDDDRFMDPKYVGCSEYNPIVTFTEEEQAAHRADHELRDRENEPNRRVTFYLFNQERLPRVFCQNYTTPDNCGRKPYAAQVRPCLEPCKRYGVDEEPGDDRPRYRESFRCVWYDSIAKNCIVEGPPVVPRDAYPEILIEELDKWFVPQTETMTLEYVINGSEVNPDKVQMEVRASHYCEAEIAPDTGAVTYTELDDDLVYSKEESAEGFTAGETREIADYKGESTAADGILKPRDGGERHLNVAFSPYTVHLRYLEDHAEDVNARIELSPFWPQWGENTSEPAVTDTVGAHDVTIAWTNAAKIDRGTLEVTDKNDKVVYMEEIEDGKLAAGAQQILWDRMYLPCVTNSRYLGEYHADDAPYTCKVTTVTSIPRTSTLQARWTIHDAPQFTAGRLQVFDGSNDLVFERNLSRTEVTQGEQTFNWDGNYKAGATNSDGGTAVIQADMPYRVQVSAHTGMDLAHGVAVTAMHTEVRLFVAEKTRAPNDFGYEPNNAPTSLAIGTAPHVPGTPPTAGTKWIRYQLAEAGFHPGPITDDSAADNAYKIALREFKRTAPANGNAVAPAFTRQRLDGNRDEAENAELTAAINSLRDSDKRAWFGSLDRVETDPGNPADPHNPDMTDAEVKSDLGDPSKDVIVWVDDRHNYTEGPAAKDETDSNYASGTPTAIAFGLKNHRGEMDIRDDREAKDRQSITRPWLPLKVNLPLVGQDDDLIDDVSFPDDEDEQNAMRKAVGPIRVDWNFDELPAEFRPEAPGYDRRYVRSRFYTAWAIDRFKAPHTRLDTGRQTHYTNCKISKGGIRSNALARYFEKPFGRGALSLAPWKPVSIFATESLATIVHDDLNGSMVNDRDLFEGAVGSAGIYFHPSRIAGDGYRVRAQVEFEDCSGYDFPNSDVLKARYPQPPQAHTARLRNWRKATIRGYMYWSPANPNHWPNHLATYRRLYRAANVYFALEGTTTPGDLFFQTSDVFDPTDPDDQRKYENIIRNNVSGRRLRDVSRMRLDGRYIWPWSHRADLGWPDPSPEGISTDDEVDNWLRETVQTPTWRSFRAGLLLALLREIEKKGKLRGNFLVEFESSPRLYCEQYVCDGTFHHRYWFIRRHNQPHGSKNGDSCPSGWCRFWGGSSLTATTAAVKPFPGLPWAAVGVKLGATWLFDSAPPQTWVHEVGHHRHLEHAASAPGAQYQRGDNNADIHDNQDNTVAAFAGGTRDCLKDWDLRCIMSYTRPKHRNFYCGKCLMRNRGWKVRTLGFPGSNWTEPA